MPTPRHDVIDNPIPTSLFLSDMHFCRCWAYKKNLNLRTNDNTFEVNVYLATGTHIKNKDVGMGLSMTSCHGLAMFLLCFS